MCSKAALLPLALSLPLLLLLVSGDGVTAAENSNDDAAALETLLQAEATSLSSSPTPPPLCPTSSTHFQCDAARCLHHEEERRGDWCGRRCTHPAPTCLHRKYVCDGVPDCEDASDEAGCVQCALDAFPCDGVCRRRELICDKAYSHCRPADTVCAGPPLTCPGQAGLGVNLTCDGVPDCAAGRDERHCTSPISCRGGAFHCDGRCLRASRRCDGVRHCEDGSDELNCPANLHQVAVIYKRAENVVLKRECFDCGNGRCVSPSVKCDGVDDCGNQRDEKRCFAPICSAGGGRNCVATKCSDQGIPCSSGYKCGRLKWACDGHPQCDAGSDEPADCRGPSKVYFCRDAGPDAVPMAASTWCDGKPDCPGSSPQDEADCPSEVPLADVYCADNRTDHAHFQGGRAVRCAPEPRLIRCHDGTPRLETTRCDGVPDCPGGEDEVGCSHCYDGAVLCDARCVMASRRCDGFYDCNDGTDERGCRDDLVLGSAFFHPRICGPGRIDCSNRCIDAQHACDGVSDCQNQADEANCNVCRGGATLCAGRCVKRVPACPSESLATCAANATASGMCDGVQDCADGQDEGSSCASEAGCTAGLFCDGMCRLRSARCDGVRDCSDGLDEADCPDGLASTTSRESWKRVNHRVEFTWSWVSVFTLDGVTTNVTTVVNDSVAVITTVVRPPPPPPEPLACPTTTTPEPPTTPEPAPTPAPPLRGPRPRKRGGGGRRKQQRSRKAKKQQEQQQEHQEEGGDP